jgi:NADH dehydrogenase
MPGTILVLGATGLLGEPVARTLRDGGVHVRVLARNPIEARARFGDAFEVVPGDATEPDDVRRALDGCWGAHLTVGGTAERRAAENVSALAREAGLQRIGYISGSTVDESNRWFPMVEDKLRAEEAVRASGVGWTIFRPTWPFEMLARFVRDGRATMIGKHPHPYHWFARDDLARMVAEAFRLQEAAEKVFWIHGPEAISMREALDRYRRALHPDIASVSVMPTWLGRTIGALTRNEMLVFASRLMAYFDKVEELGDPADTNRMLGAPTVTLDRWLEARGRAA